jgi:Peroxisomal biogenesis factor 11 (PEX11)
MDAMGIWNTTWGKDVLIEANRFWFYSLILSLCCSLWTLSVSTAGGSKARSNSNRITEKTQQPQKEPNDKERQPSPTPVVKQIVADSLDLLIPGTIVGWIAASPVQVGLATIISTVVTAQDIWIKAQPAP